jgi:hypothetical protein
MNFGALDIENAKREAIERCNARHKPELSTVCRIYAVGDDVV